MLSLRFRRGPLPAVLQLGLQIEQSVTGIRHLDQLLACRITGLPEASPNVGGPDDHLGIDGIVLG